METPIKLFGLTIGKRKVIESDFVKSEIIIKRKLFGFISWSTRVSAKNLEVIVDGETKFIRPVELCFPLPVKGEYFQYTGMPTQGYVLSFEGQVVDVKYKIDGSNYKQVVTVCLYIESF